MLVNEVLENFGLAHSKNQAEKYIDATLGSGGHSVQICERGGFVLGIEADEHMLALAEKRLEIACPGHFKLVGDNFINIDTIAKESGFEQINGVLFDLGISSLHYTDLKRGFSFDNPDETLDMRLDVKTQGLKAMDLLNALNVKQLEQLFSTVFANFEAKKIAKKVLKVRNLKPFEKVADVESLTYEKAKLFLALRIGVNTEIDNIRIALPKAFSLIRKGGRLLVISFHSLEDRVVKRTMLDLVEQGNARLITKKPIEPKSGEIADNPKSRSAKLWVLEKI